ncbi:MAG: bifunctional 5,10-methylene-tetrahydrofolate dehydrogenase/5,10-methylene-tetrahydrofolate cyclohydrolase [Candidatus Omnitrophica bacterium CG11_big_fil_rev_8_21_14_0_20_63_9]|nr:MAG: bifunctional 5,10-methylene-tetrahydrofolate dehydrogenase/5,10-methylene-tetrahydrofolate cyclohydrolase [Candidatus Omnitrophica bacterium CG11_big_fil_rev_8_21_14_0_20_63_9]
MINHIVLNGHLIAERIKTALRQELARLSSPPTLGILYFQSPASEVYKAAQLQQAASLGIRTVEEPVPVSAPQAQVEGIIQRWNDEPTIHGIFVHQPMPPQIDPQRVSAAIDPRKDIEGIHPQNSARRFFAKARIGSCTALAVMELIESTGVDLAGKEAVVVGHSEIVGRPVSMLLLDKLATTTICHLGTDKAGRLEEHVRRAEILVVAVGRPQLIKGAWIKPGAIVIDVGINLVKGRVVGDVEFEAAKKRAAFISPVPGGVGPVTVMMVMKNTIEAYKLQRDSR